MDEQSKIAVDKRKMQEDRSNLANSGILDELARWHKDVYDSYIRAGFSPIQALELTKASASGK